MPRGFMPYVCTCNEHSMATIGEVFSLTVSASVTCKKYIRQLCYAWLQPMLHNRSHVGIFFRLDLYLHVQMYMYMYRRHEYA